MVHLRYWRYGPDLRQGELPTYTAAARADYDSRDIDVEYIDVRKSREAMEQMLGYSGGHRRVPVIVDDGKVTIGFGGT